LHKKKGNIYTSSELRVRISLRATNGSKVTPEEALRQILIVRHGPGIEAVPPGPEANESITRPERL
jgi:hypothetical protein